MSYARGILNAIYRKEDQEAELARFKEKLLESRKTTLIPALMERIGRFKEEVAESKNRVSTAENLGFSKEAAVILEIDGQLSLQLEKLSKLDPDELNKKQLKIISNTIVESLPEEKVAQAMNYVLQGDLSFTGLTDGPDVALAALWNSGEEEFYKSLSKLSRLMTDQRIPAPDLDVGEFTSRSAFSMSLSERTALNNNLKAQIGPALGLSIVKLADGTLGFQGKDPDQAQIVLNNAMDVYDNLYNNPTYLDNPNTTITKIADKIYQLRKQGYTTEQIAANPYFELNFTGTIGTGFSQSTSNTSIESDIPQEKVNPDLFN